MLQYQTVDPETLELLKKLQKISEFSKLRLVGGTSLALQTGHRNSVDLDLFGKIDFENYNILPELNKIGTLVVLKQSKNINIFLIDGIKVDFVNYIYEWIDKPIHENGLILASKKDIAAMKLAAVTGRGNKKDFIDIFFLSKEFSLKEMLDFYMKKYPDGSQFLVLKSLTYFKDAEKNEMPIMYNNVAWKIVKIKMKQIVSEY